MRGKRLVKLALMSALLINKSRAPGSVLPVMAAVLAAAAGSAALAVGGTAAIQKKRYHWYSHKKF
jgi:hypothetical protein